MKKEINCHFGTSTNHTALQRDRINELNAALDGYHTVSDVRKLRFIIKLDPNIREIVLNALSSSGMATNNFLAEVASFKRKMAESKLTRHLAGVEKRKGKRGPNSRTRDRVVPSLANAWNQYRSMGRNGVKQEASSG